MKNWKAVLAGFLAFLLFAFVPCAVLCAQEGETEEETEEAIPDSYYYPIESNGISGWPQGPAVEAASAAVLDMDSGAFLYSKQATEKQYPASITKIMTTLLLVETCDLDQEITFSEIVYDLEEGSSHLGIQPGETMTLRDAAYGIMLASANDIANGVAEHIGGSIRGFADLMNERAAQLGCVNTHFSNPHGLYSEDHYTCAHDMALIAAAAYANPAFREIACAKEYTIPETNLTEEERSFLNHQKLIQKDSEYYWQYARGGKTGYTSQCLNTLVTYAEKDGKSLVSVVLRVNGAGKAYQESRQILEYGFDNFSEIKYKRSSYGRTFYDIMGLNYLGEAAAFQSDAWRREPCSDCAVCVTVPNTADAGSLEYEAVQGSGNSKRVSYSYEGTFVGNSTGIFHSIYAPVRLPFEKTAAPAAEEKEEVSGSRIQIENLNDVLEQTSAVLGAVYLTGVGWAQEHPTAVIAGGAAVLLILAVFIVVLIFRCTADYRIQRRRKQEEKERKLREEEIERMTTAEIEAELRAVMEQERIRKEQELLEQAEAERAAADARKLEEEAHEMERLIQELEDERKERQKAQNTGDK